MKNNKVIDLKTRKEIEFANGQFDRLNIPKDKRSMEKAPEYFKERLQMEKKVETMLSAIIRKETDGVLAWSVLAEHFAYILLPDARDLMESFDDATNEQEQAEARKEIERILTIADELEDFQLKSMATYIDKVSETHES